MTYLAARERGDFRVTLRERPLVFLTLVLAGLVVVLASLRAAAPAVARRGADARTVLVRVAVLSEALPARGLLGRLRAPVLDVVAARARVALGDVVGRAPASERTTLPARLVGLREAGVVRPMRLAGDVARLVAEEVRPFARPRLALPRVVFEVVRFFGVARATAAFLVSSSTVLMAFFAFANVLVLRMMIPSLRVREECKESATTSWDAATFHARDGRTYREAYDARRLMTSRRRAQRRRPPARVRCVCVSCTRSAPRLVA